jgi:hypothetical protein
MAVEQEIVTGKRFFYMMRSDYEELSAGEVTRYQRIRAHLSDTQWLGPDKMERRICGVQSWEEGSS